MKTVGIAILALIALFTGGCSLLFITFALQDSSPLHMYSIMAVPLGAGLIVCALAILWIRRLLRPTPSDQTPPP